MSHHISVAKLSVRVLAGNAGATQQVVAVTFWPLTWMEAPPSLSCVKRVAMYPYVTALHRILYIPHSRATVFVKPTMPALACHCRPRSIDFIGSASLIARHHQKTLWLPWLMAGMVQWQAR